MRVRTDRATIMTSRSPTCCRNSDTDLARGETCVLETERLTLRRPTLADVKAIARLANDRRIAENTRRLPHPYSQDHAVEFVRAMADDRARDRVPDREQSARRSAWSASTGATPDAPELGYWLGVEHWGQGFATEAARAAIDFFFEEIEHEQLYAGARVANPASRNVLEKCGFQWSGVRAAPLRGAGLVDARSTASACRAASGRR